MNCHNLEVIRDSCGGIRSLLDFPYIFQPTDKKRLTEQRMPALDGEKLASLHHGETRTRI
jgi:hypothetical protein